MLDRGNGRPNAGVVGDGPGIILRHIEVCPNQDPLTRKGEISHALKSHFSSLKKESPTGSVGDGARG